MKTASVDSLKNIFDIQEKSSTNEELKEFPIIYTHVEGYDKEAALYEVRIFIALGKYIKDITIDAAFACGYPHNNRRLFLKVEDNSDPEELLVRKLSTVIYDKEDTLCYMKI